MKMWNIFKGDTLWNEYSRKVNQENKFKNLSIQHSFKATRRLSSTNNNNNNNNSCLQEYQKMWSLWIYKVFSYVAEWMAMWVYFKWQTEKEFHLFEKFHLNFNCFNIFLVLTYYTCYLLNTNFSHVIYAYGIINN